MNRKKLVSILIKFPFLPYWVALHYLDEGHEFSHDAIFEIKK